MLPLPFLTALLPLTSALSIPPQDDSVPSIHPLTGPAPPEVAPAPHGESRPVTDTAPKPETDDAAAVGRFWTGWQNVQNLFVLFVLLSFFCAIYVS